MGSAAAFRDGVRAFFAAAHDTTAAGPAGGAQRRERSYLSFDPRAQILDNVEIQHRILENIPALQAIAGFNEIQGRRLSDQEVRKDGGV